jgi:hypothetical protein
VDVGAAVVLAVIGWLLHAAHADQGGTTTVGADTQPGLNDWGGHERSANAAYDPRVLSATAQDHRAFGTKRVAGKVV